MEGRRMGNGADQRHADFIFKKMGLEGANAEGTLGEFETKDADEEGEEPLGKVDATKHLGITERMNYLFADRPEIMYATKSCLAIWRHQRKTLIKR
jgi:hypothetical protein